jgi:hypothetical protein
MPLARRRMHRAAVIGPARLGIRVPFDDETDFVRPCPLPHCYRPTGGGERGTRFVDPRSLGDSPSVTESSVRLVDDRLQGLDPLEERSDGEVVGERLFVLVAGHPDRV